MFQESHVHQLLHYSWNLVFAWPVQYIIEQRQLIALKSKQILNRDNTDSVCLAYREMLNINLNLIGQMMFLVYGKNIISIRISLQHSKSVKTSMEN